MEVQVLGFGMVKDIFGASSVSFKLENSLNNVSGLKVVMENTYPKLKELTSYMVAINNNYASLTDRINENDEIALIPPVTGG